MQAYMLDALGVLDSSAMRDSSLPRRITMPKPFVKPPSPRHATCRAPRGPHQLPVELAPPALLSRSFPDTASARVLAASPSPGAPRPRPVRSGTVAAPCLDLRLRARGAPIHAFQAAVTGSRACGEALIRWIRIVRGSPDLRAPSLGKNRAR